MEFNHTDVRDLACDPIENIRVGFVGLGNRGLATLRRYMILEGITVTCLCDLRPANVRKAADILQDNGKPVAREFTDKDSWMLLAEDPDIDMLCICTDWSTHTDIAVKAMTCGKHVAIEVPAALTVADCWRLVDTAEETRRHCFMLENCCFDPFALSTLQMKRKGWFGEITHCEGAYIHDLRARYRADENAGGFHNGWIARYCGSHVGNPYPTHGLGPISQLLDLNHGDRMDYLVSMSPAVNHSSEGIYINNTLIRTVRGKTILLQYDVTTPRPYSRLQTVCGTRGFIRKYPVACAADDSNGQLEGEALDALLKEFRHPYEREYRADAERLGVENIMNYMMDRHLVKCLQKGLVPDINVYDAAAWSCITELSEISVRKGGIPVKIPDFTRGRWE